MRLPWATERFLAFAVLLCNIQVSKSYFVGAFWRGIFLYIWGSLQFVLLSDNAFSLTFVEALQNELEIIAIDWMLELQISENILNQP